MKNLIVYSPFDSQHYGLRIGKVIISSPTKDFGNTIRVAKKEGYNLLFVRVNLKQENDPLKITMGVVLKKFGANFINTIVSLKSDLNSKISITNDGIESYDIVSDHSDLEVISRIAAESIFQSHLFLDLKLPVKRTRELHALWARNDATGRCKQTLIARRRKKVVGFLTIKEGGFIDLIAVDKKFQGQGIGKSLISKSIEWLSQNCKSGFIGTQNDNPAYYLYQRFNFKPFSWEDIYHLWLN